MKLEIQTFDYSFPTTEVPAWSPQVDRWYQLDAPAYGLAQAFSAHFLASKTDRPHFLILASAGSSGETDFQFARAEVPSPSKFVHTLPSVRAVPLMQLLQWQGPLLCFQNDPQTWVTGLETALNLCDESTPEIWVVGAHFLEESLWRTTFARLMHTGTSLDKQISPSRFLIEPSKVRKNASRAQTLDSEFWAWLKNQKAGPFELSSGWELRPMEGTV